MVYIKDTIGLTKIRDLNLSRNPIKNKGIKLIGEMLSRGGLVLETLNLSDCKFDSMGATYIYEGIKRNNKLKTLILDSNNL